MEATVYLLLRLDRPGHVADAIAQQVNLNVTGSERVISRWREVFAGPSLGCGENAGLFRGRPGRPRLSRAADSDRVSVERAGRTRAPRLRAVGGLCTGPVTVAPWSDADAMLSGAADALSQDGIYGEPTLSLLTPLGPA
jgi:hypothetical protein